MLAPQNLTGLLVPSVSCLHFNSYKRPSERLQIVRVSVHYRLLPLSAVGMNISSNASGFFPSSILAPDGDPEDDECLGLWLSLLFFFFFCETQAGEGGGGDLEPATRETTASEVVPLEASWDFLT